MNTQLTTEERLWDYIDGRSGVEETSFIEEMIAVNLEWKAKYADLMDVHQLMNNHIELDEPSMRFTQNVMEDIARYQISPATKTYLNKKIIWSIAGFFIVTLIGMIGYGLGQIDWNTGSSTSLPINFSQIDFSKVYNNSYTNIFIMVNVVLGLMLLDMYLGKKKEEAGLEP